MNIESMPNTFEMHITRHQVIAISSQIQSLGNLLLLVHPQSMKISHKEKENLLATTLIKKIMTENILKFHSCFAISITLRLGIILRIRKKIHNH